MTCFPPCLLSFLSHHNHHHDVLKNTKKTPFFQKKMERKRKQKNEKNAESQFCIPIIRRVARRAPILDANSGCGGRPGPPRVYLGPGQCHFFQKKQKIGKKKKQKNKKNKKPPNLSFGCELPEKLTRRAVILDANSGCGGRPGPPRVYLGLGQCHF